MKDIQALRKRQNLLAKCVLRKQTVLKRKQQLIMEACTEDEDLDTSSVSTVLDVSSSTMNDTTLADSQIGDISHTTEEATEDEYNSDDTFYNNVGNPQDTSTPTLNSSVLSVPEVLQKSREKLNQTLVSSSESNISVARSAPSSSAPRPSPSLPQVRHSSSGDLDEICFSCKKRGHKSTLCPDNPIKCMKCRQMGHGWRECPVPTDQLSLDLQNRYHAAMAKRKERQVPPRNAVSSGASRLNPGQPSCGCAGACNCSDAARPAWSSGIQELDYIAWNDQLVDLTDAAGRRWAVQRRFLERPDREAILENTERSHRFRNYEIVVTGFEWNIYSTETLAILIRYLCSMNGVIPEIRVHQPEGRGAQLYVSFPQVMEHRLRPAVDWAILQMRSLRLNSSHRPLVVRYAYRRPGSSPRDIDDRCSF
jgi:hypothetical protein